jgi:hypothetical protein
MKSEGRFTTVICIALLTWGVAISIAFVGKNKGKEAGITVIQKSEPADWRVDTDESIQEAKRTLAYIWKYQDRLEKEEILLYVHLMAHFWVEYSGDIPDQILWPSKEYSLKYMTDVRAARKEGQ